MRPAKPLTCFCTRCPFQGSARRIEALMEIVEEHAVWCSVERARAAVALEQRAAAEQRDVAHG